MQLSDRGGQLTARPAPNPTVAPGWANNDLTQSTPPTIGDPDMINAILAELLNVLAQVGLSASKANVAQVLQAIMRIAGGNLTEASGATEVLTADNAGIVLINATSNNVAITLPDSASANGQTLKFDLVRLDSSSNTVTYTLSGSDTIYPTATLPASIAPATMVSLQGDGVSKYVNVTTLSFGTANGTVTPAADTGTANAMVISLSPAPASLAALAGRLLLITKSNASSTGAITIVVDSLTSMSVVRPDGVAFSSTTTWPANRAGLTYCTGTELILLDPLNTAMEAWTENIWPDGGTANALTVTLSPAPSNLAALAGAIIPIMKGSAGNTGALTINPNGIGNTSVTLPDGSPIPGGGWPASTLGLVGCTGTALLLLNLPSPTGMHGVQVFTSSGTFTVQSPNIEVEVWGAGGGAQGSLSGNSVSGGAGGGYARKRITGLTVGSTITVTVGTGGAAGANGSGAAGTAGGASSFGSYCSATGGPGGPGGGPATPGGTGTGGDINATGGGGSAGLGTSSSTGGPGGAGAMGGGGGAASNSGNNAGPGGFPAGGGGGAGSGGSNSSGAGANGLVVVRW